MNCVIFAGELSVGDDAAHDQGQEEANDCRGTEAAREQERIIDTDRTTAFQEWADSVCRTTGSTTMSNARSAMDVADDEIDGQEKGEGGEIGVAVEKSQKDNLEGKEDCSVFQLSLEELKKRLPDELSRVPEFAVPSSVQVTGLSRSSPFELCSRKLLRDFAPFTPKGGG